LKQAKSKTLGDINIPKKYFADFLRGCIDGDGNINITRHPESTHPQLRVRLCSASPNFLIWVKGRIEECFNIKSGWIQSFTKRTIRELTFGKRDAILIFKHIYYPDVESFLNRKYQLAKPFMGE
jgi:hypothetical protein